MQVRFWKRTFQKRKTNFRKNELSKTNLHSGKRKTNFPETKSELTKNEKRTFKNGKRKTKTNFSKRKTKNEKRTFAKTNSRKTKRKRTRFGGPKTNLHFPETKNELLQKRTFRNEKRTPPENKMGSQARPNGDSFPRPGPRRPGSKRKRGSQARP